MVIYFLKFQLQYTNIKKSTAKIMQYIEIGMTQRKDRENKVAIRWTEKRLMIIGQEGSNGMYIFVTVAVQ